MTPKIPLVSLAGRLGVPSVAGVVIALVPLYGYFVHASHDSQLVGLLVILSWVITCFFVIFSLVATLVKYRRGQKTKYAGSITAYFFLTGLLGYGGAHTAFFELIAG